MAPLNEMDSGIEIKRNINQFSGSVLYINGGSADLLRLEQEQIEHPQDVIYTIHSDPIRKPDIVGNIYADKTYQSLPVERFSTIYLNGVAADSNIKMQDLFKALFKLLKPDGILVYNGGSIYRETALAQINNTSRLLYQTGLQPLLKYASPIADNEVIVASKDKTTSSDACLKALPLFLLKQFSKKAGAELYPIFDKLSANKKKRPIFRERNEMLNNLSTEKMHENAQAFFTRSSLPEERAFKRSKSDEIEKKEEVEHNPNVNRMK